MSTYKKIILGIIIIATTVGMLGLYLPMRAPVFETPPASESEGQSGSNASLGQAVSAASSTFSLQKNPKATSTLSASGQNTQKQENKSQTAKSKTPESFSELEEESELIKKLKDQKSLEEIDKILKDLNR